jgi:hypothetical protein
VLIDRALPHSLAVMREHDDQWVLLYQDRVAEVWGLAARFDDPASDDYIAPRERLVCSALPGDDLPWPALPVRRAPRPALATQTHEPRYRDTPLFQHSNAPLIPPDASIDNLLSVGHPNKPDEAVP